ncbi:hypothetical protein AB1Y20_011879 [Prymnesium parvum]|uniref:Uncharacterized protein n=1 Tax=Prymnesium parvum TaxID=97485 RepID=A0AB34IKN8_PRYPA
MQLERWRTCAPWRPARTAPLPLPPFLLLPRPPSSPLSLLSLHDFAYLVAVGSGAILTRRGWAYDSSHAPPHGRLPLSFSARVVPAPPALGGSLAPLDAASVHAPHLPAVAPHARLLLVFVEPSTTPVLPHSLHAPHPSSPFSSPSASSSPSSAASSPPPSLPSASAAARLYWRLVTTDSCEAVHSGALLLLSALASRGIFVCPPPAAASAAPPDPILHFGLANAYRAAPFTRLLMLPLASCAAAAGRGGAPPSLALHPPPRAPPHGGALHQLLWCATAAGRTLVMDFTGAQYGVDARLPSTHSPFWCEDAPAAGARVRGFELCGGVAMFSEGEAREAALRHPMHRHVAEWIRDSALRVLDHRLRGGEGGGGA